MQLRRRSTAVWRSCQRRAMESSIGSCKQSLQDVRRSPSRPRQALAVFERAKINLDDTQWYAPELRRIRGELALGNGEGLTVCRQYFLSALELSDRQASLSWALRAATSLAVAENSTGRKEAAWRALQTTHAKFREGLQTSDLRLARQVLTVSNLRDGDTNSMH